MLIPRHSEVYGRVYSEARNGRKWHEKNYFKNPTPANRIDSMFSSETCFGTEFRVVVSSGEENSKCLLIFLFHGTEFRVVFSSADGSEWNSEHLLLILFHGTEFRAFFSSAERFGMEFREFSVPSE